MFDMNEAQLQDFMERISATAIANQAILKCMTSRTPMTVDNVILFVGDFFDPSNPAFENLIGKINDAIVYVVERHKEGPTSDDLPKSNVTRLFS